MTGNTSAVEGWQPPPQQSPRVTSNCRLGVTENTAMTVSAGETDALICAFRLSPCGALGLEALDLLPSIEHPLWFHFNVLDNRARRYLDKIPDLDEETRDMLIGSETRIQARVMDDGFAVILGDLHHDFNLDPEAFGTIRNLYLLSIVTTALLPITFITGVFGMNVGGLPFLESKHGFFWVMFIMTITLVATMLLLRKKRVL
jgi:Mg2+ and Co2+ transporter CorA